MRIKCGAGVNPNVEQFRSLYRKLIIGAKSVDFDVCSTNVIPLDDTINLPDIDIGTSEALNESQKFYQISDEEMSKNYRLSDDDILLYNVDSSIDNSACEYISGFLVRKLRLKFACEDCLSLLIVDRSQCTDYNKLIRRKEYGKLVYPSQDCVKVVKVCDTILKCFQLKFDVFTEQKVVPKIVMNCMMEINSKIPDIFHIEGNLRDLICHKRRERGAGKIRKILYV